MLRVRMNTEHIVASWTLACLDCGVPIGLELEYQRVFLAGLSVSELVENVTEKRKTLRDVAERIHDAGCSRKVGHATR